MMDQVAERCPTCGHKKVDNARVLTEVLENARGRLGVSYTDLAHGLGYYTSAHGRRADSTRVKRQLGVAPHAGPKGRRYFSHSMSAEIALRYCEALGLAPVEVGL